MSLRAFLLSILTVFLLITPLLSVPKAPPTSARSKKAIAKVKTQLEEDLAKKGMKFGAPIYIRIFKKEEKLELWVKKGKEFELFRSYPVCTYGGEGLGPKTMQGDGKAPEGFYFVTAGQFNPYSSYHLAFNIGYPNKFDRHHKRTGGYIMVHGNCVSIGCFAMTNKKINEIYALADAAVRNGQSFFRVHIFPFRMTSDNLVKYSNYKWLSFWKNLKEGYDKFTEKGNIPPSVSVKNGRYIFGD